MQTVNQYPQASRGIMQGNNRVLEPGKIVKNRHEKEVATEVLLENDALMNQTKPVMGVIFRKGLGKEQLIKRIQKQIRLDKQLIDLKHHVTETNREPLSQLLWQKYGISADKLALSPEQLDPFFASKKITSLEMLARELYIQLQIIENHWSEAIHQKFDQSVIINLFMPLQRQNSSHTISVNSFANQLNKLLGDDSILIMKDVIAIYRQITPFNLRNLIANLSRPRICLPSRG